MTSREAADLLVDQALRAAAVKSERSVYRVMAVQGIHQLHAAFAEIARLRRQNAALRDEIRRLRGQQELTTPRPERREQGRAA